MRPLGFEGFGGLERWEIEIKEIWEMELKRIFVSRFAFPRTRLPTIPPVMALSEGMPRYGNDDHDEVEEGYDDKDEDYDHDNDEDDEEWL